MAEEGQQQRNPSVKQAADVSPEKQVETDKRLKAMQWESLGSTRRDQISTNDYKENQPTPDLRTAEATRLLNQPGTEEWRTAREKKPQLSNWTNAWHDLNNDGTAEEDLEDIAGGQAHRIKLAKAEAQARSEGDNPYEDTTNRRKGGYNATRSDRARGGGVFGTRGRGGVRRGSTRELTSHSTSTTLRPLETVGGTTRPTVRGAGNRDRRGTAPTPGLRTAGPSSRGRGASRQTARGSVLRTPSREQLPACANRKVSARSQRPSASNYEAFLTAPETFMATYQSRLVERQAATATAPGLSDLHAANTSSGAPGIRPRDTTKTNPASNGEHDATRESSIHSNTLPADSSVVFSQEIDSAPVGVRVPTPPPHYAATSESLNEASYLEDLMDLEWQERDPAASSETAAESRNVASENMSTINTSLPDHVIPSSDAMSALARLLPFIRSELDPSVMAQLEAFTARGPMQSQTGDSGRQPVFSVPLSGDRASSKREPASMNTVGLLDSTSAHTNASSSSVSQGQLSSHTEGSPMAWTSNVEADDYEGPEDSPVIFGEHVYRGGATSKGPTAVVDPPASSTTDSKLFAPVSEPSLQRMPQPQSEGRLAVFNPFLGAPEQAGHRAPQFQPLADAYTSSRDTPEVSPNTATERTNVSFSTGAVSAALPMAPGDSSFRNRLSSRTPATLESETEGITQNDSLGSPPLQGNLTRSVYASAGDGKARRQRMRSRAHTSVSDDIIGEHLLPDLQRHNFGEAPGHDDSVQMTAAHTWFTTSAAHTRFGSPATSGIVPATAVMTPCTSEAFALRPESLSLETDSSDVAVGRRIAETGTASRPHNVGGPEAPTIPSRYISPARPSTSSAFHGNAGRGRGSSLRRLAPQLPAFLANNPAPSSDPGAAAARQYGLDRPRSPVVPSRPVLRTRERDDPVSGERVDLQASIFAAPYTGPPPLDRPTINSSGFLKPSDDVGPSDSLRGMGSKKDPWDMARKYGSGS